MKYEGRRVQGTGRKEGRSLMGSGVLGREGECAAARKQLAPMRTDAAWRAGRTQSGRLGGG